MTELRVKLHQPLAYGYLEAAAVATVRLVAESDGAVAKKWWSEEKPVAISGADGGFGDFTRFALPQGGYYAITITRPRGTDISKESLVKDGETLTETIEMAVSPHEYLGWQQFAGIVRARPYEKETDPFRDLPTDDATPRLAALRASRDHLEALYRQTAPIPTLVPTQIPIGRDAWSWAASLTPASLARLPVSWRREPAKWPTNDDREFVAWFPPTPTEAEGLELVRQLHDIPAGVESAAGFDRWLLAQSPQRTDLASVPWAWWGGRRDKFDQMRLFYDRVRPSPIDHDVPGRFTITVQDRWWTGLLEFLGSDRLYRAEEMLDRTLSAENRYELYSPQMAMEGKTKGPLAATAGAIILVSRAPTEPQVWDPWLDNLSNWFRGIPDGAIIRGYRRVEQATTLEHLTMAYGMLREGIERGIPFFSASIRLLSAALARLADVIPDAGRDRGVIASVATQVDPDQPFTVMRLPNR